jgi:uncharacterized protein YbaR (Trm112 family)
MRLAPWCLDNLVCPRDKARLDLEKDGLACVHGHYYPVVDGIPIMLLDDVEQTAVIGACPR